MDRDVETLSSDVLTTDPGIGIDFGSSEHTGAQEGGTKRWSPKCLLSQILHGKYVD